MSQSNLDPKTPSDNSAQYIGQAPLQMEEATTGGSYIDLWGEPYYCIAHYDQMPPFFMSLVSSADHWMFISSSGGLNSRSLKCRLLTFPLRDRR